MYNIGPFLRKFKSNGIYPVYYPFNIGHQVPACPVLSFLKQLLETEPTLPAQTPTIAQPVPMLNDNCMIFSGYVITKLQ